MPGGPGQGTWLGPPTVEGPVGQSTHIPGAQTSTFSWAHGRLWESPTHQAPPSAARCSRRAQAAAPPFPQGRPSCRSQMEKASQKQPYHIGKCLKTSSRSSPPGPASLRILLDLLSCRSRQWGLFWAAWRVFKALAGPHSWGNKKPDLGKTFLKLLLLRLLWLPPNLSCQALRP